MAVGARPAAQPKQWAREAANERRRFNQKLERKIADTRARLSAAAITRWDIMVGLQRHEERRQLTARDALHGGDI